MKKFSSNCGPLYRQQCGILAIEMAIILPLLILFMSAIVGFGLAFREQIKLIEALEVANRGANSIQPHGSRGEISGLCEKVKDTVRDVLEKSGLEPNNYDVNVEALNLNDVAPIPALSACYAFGVPAFRVTVTRNSSDILGHISSITFTPSAQAIVVTGFKKVVSGSC